MTIVTARMNGYSIRSLIINYKKQQLDDFVLPTIIGLHLGLKCFSPQINKNDLPRNINIIPSFLKYN